MTFQEAESVIARITYKPNYFITLSYGMSVELILRIGHQSTDADNPSEPLPLPVYTYSLINEEMLADMNEIQFVRMIRDKIKTLEFHELDEWLKIDGMHVVDPHPELRSQSGATLRFR